MRSRCGRAKSCIGGRQSVGLPASAGLRCRSHHRGTAMFQKQSDMTPVVDLTGAKGAGPFRTQRPIYIDLLPPCNDACPAGEDIQAWLALAQAEKSRAAWERLVRDNPL